LIAGFYGIVDLPAAAGPAEAEALAAQLLDGGAPMIQLRMKRAPTRALLACARTLRALCSRRGAGLCVNDRLDVALLSSADAVHLGQDDLPLGAARALAAGRLLIGISTHSLAQAQAALTGGADYLGFGPVWGTASKPHPDPVQGLSALAAVVRAAGPVPVVAIGGITPVRAAAVANAGAAAAAAIAAVNQAPDPTAAARSIHHTFRASG